MKTERSLAATLLCMLLLSGCAQTVTDAPSKAQPQAAAATDWSRAQPLEVVMIDFSFSPEAFSLQAGQPYTLRVVNKGSGLHDFSSRAFFNAVEVRPEHASRLEDAKLRANAGETKEVSFVAVRPGTYPFECSVFLHSLFGMVGEVRID